MNNIQILYLVLLSLTFNTYFETYLEPWQALIGLLCDDNWPAGIYLFKVNNSITWTRCEISSKLTIKLPERRYCRLSCVFIVNFKHISHLLMFLMLTLKMQLRAGWRLKAVPCFCKNAPLRMYNRLLNTPL